MSFEKLGLKRSESVTFGGYLSQRFDSSSPPNRLFALRSLSATRFRSRIGQGGGVDAHAALLAEKGREWSSFEIHAVLDLFAFEFECHLIDPRTSNQILLDVRALLSSIRAITPDLHTQVYFCLCIFSGFFRSHFSILPAVDLDFNSMPKAGREFGPVFDC
jgi:hypothetical protein